MVKKVMVIMLACVLLCIGLCGCFSGGDKVTIDNIRPNTKYQYEDILEHTNCLIDGAYELDQGGTEVFYYPVCSGCSEVGGIKRVVVWKDSYAKSFSCGSCFTSTEVKLEVD